MKFSLLTSLFLLVGVTALAQTDAADYFDGQPWGWACCANQQGSAYPLDGGMRAAQPTTIVLTSNGADNANAIMSAIAQYDIIVLDGSAGDFVIGSQMTIANAQHKTIVGRNHAVLATQFYLTDADVAYLKAQPLLKGVLAGHLHIDVADRFSPTAMEYVVGGNFLFHGAEITFT